jgi:hypothetical protein
MLINLARSTNMELIMRLICLRKVFNACYDPLNESDDHISAACVIVTITVNDTPHRIQCTFSVIFFSSKSSIDRAILGR